MTRTELRGKYRQLAAQYTNYKCLVDGAAFCAEILKDLESLWASEAEEELGLAEAATYSGYSTDHLRRLVREGKLRADRHGRRLTFRAVDLPKKSGAVDRPEHSGYDPVADARQVAAQRSHGGNSHDALTVT